jgi:hypothetical protein
MVFRIYWDPTPLPRLRVLMTDNRDENLVVREWRSPAELIEGYLLPEIIEGWFRDLEDSLGIG